MCKYKNISILIIPLFLSLIFIGCGQIKLNTSTTINGDESGKAAFYISYDDAMHSTLNRDIFNAQWAKDNGFILNKYNKDSMNVEELSYKFNNLKEIQDKINYTNVLNMSYETKLGLNTKTYYINLKFNKDIIDDLTKKTLNSGSDKKNTEIYNYIQDVTLSNSITVPGQLIESNCSETINENTGIWNYKFSQINKNTEIKIVYTVHSYSMLIYLCILVLICAGGGYYYIKKIRKR